MLKESTHNPAKWNKWKGDKLGKCLYAQVLQPTVALWADTEHALEAAPIIMLVMLPTVGESTHVATGA